MLKRKCNRTQEGPGRQHWKWEPRIQPGKGWEEQIKQRDQGRVGEDGKEMGGGGEVAPERKPPSSPRGSLGEGVAVWPVGSPGWSSGESATSTISGSWRQSAYIIAGPGRE